MKKEIVRRHKHHLDCYVNNISKTGTEYKVLSIIIPAYNEWRTIKEIIAQVNNAGSCGLRKEIVVVNDGSRDKTNKIMRREVLSQYNNVKYFSHSKNRGKGLSIRTALPYVTGDIILIQDADLEYDPSDYARLVTPIINGEAKVVYGSRYLKYHYLRSAGWIYRIGGFTLTHLFNTLYGSKITDLPTCYKVFDGDLLRQIELECQSFEFCVEVSAKLTRLGCQVKEISINYRPRSVAQGKKIKFKHAVEAALFMFKYRFSSKNKFLKKSQDLKEIVPEYHSKFWFVKNVFHSRLDTAIEIADLEGDCNVLEMGAGEGELLKKLSEKKKNGVLNGSIWGIDINPNIENLKIEGVDIKQCDMRKTSFSDNHFDVVFCLDVLEHFESLKEPVDELVRILKPGGRLIVSVPSENFIYKLGRFIIKGTFSSSKGPAAGQHFWTVREVKDFLRKDFILEVQEDIWNKYLKLFSIIEYSVKKR